MKRERYFSMEPIWKPHSVRVNVNCFTSTPLSLHHWPSNRYRCNQWNFSSFCHIFNIKWCCTMYVYSTINYDTACTSDIKEYDAFVQITVSLIHISYQEIDCIFELDIECYHIDSFAFDSMRLILRTNILIYINHVHTAI